MVAGSRSEAYGATAVLMSREDATINMMIAALGGEGGGILTNWLIAAAEQSGWWCRPRWLGWRSGQVRRFILSSCRDKIAHRSVMSLFPAQGDIDMAVAKIAEAGRMISRGFISPDSMRCLTIGFSVSRRKVPRGMGR